MSASSLYEHKVNLQIISTFLASTRSQFNGRKIEEPDSYIATSKPQDVSGTRAILGYDKYEHQPVEHPSRNTKPRYGNNWEQFDTSNDYQQYNFPYSG